MSALSPTTASERTLWLAADGWSVQILDQTKLPYQRSVVRLRTMEEAAHAILSMQVRGAPLIGVTAAYGMALAMRADSGNRNLRAAYSALAETRPTAINLRWALDRMTRLLEPLPKDQRTLAAYNLAAQLIEEDIATNLAIGHHGLEVFRQLIERKGQGKPLQVMTHCNAGRMATLDWGTATAPMYLAHQLGLPIHVWVSETRPRNQGAALTAWELGERGVPLTVITDNSAGHLMQRGLVDVVIVGADRVTASGDACNKIGTYLKALAAKENRVPFYVAFPESTIDWTISDGVSEIPIEQRNAREVTHVRGTLPNGRLGEVRITPESAAARNDAFDVTPAKLVTGLITEKGVCRASAAGLTRLFRRAKSTA